ncbi:hypothetical protein [Microbacterium sp. P05]|uniref:hypothetical protein n=1 Tax=Microbacterium sp. P05 TaxID=3366948 RepID=UPI003745052E
MIDALERLGEALGYATIREHSVGKTAAVDISWTAADYNDVPLFVFEVESTASAGLANNALKVFGKPSAELAKPLFFFHLVVAAGSTNERILSAQRMWGSHNYRVFRLSDAVQRSAIVPEILRQHRRVSNRIDIPAVVGALDGARWGDADSIEQILELLVELRFDTPYLRSFASLAIDDLSLLHHYAQRVSALRTADVVPSREGYAGGPGDYVGGMLELSLAITAGEISDEDGASLLEAWAISPGQYPRMIDAAFGLSRDYDGFVLGVAPYQCALATATLRQKPRSAAWVIRDLHRLFVAEGQQGVLPDYRLIAGVWLANMLASVPGNFGLSGEFSPGEVDEMFSSIQRCVEAAGGLPDGWLESPPSPFGELDELDSLVADVRGRIGLMILPELAERLSSGAALLHDFDAEAESRRWCLQALVSHDVYGRPTKNLVGLLVR